jgi:phosphoribosylformylglycinamidine cyclo-ligase
MSFPLNGRAAPAECRPRKPIDSAEVEGKTYEAAGVSLALAESVVDRLRAAVEATGTEGFGAFAGLYPLDDERLLAATIDSAGTKLVLARKAGRLRQIGADLAAHCVNDVITTGAEPLFFLDYVVGHSLSLEQVAELVEGAAEICREAGCALLGGETAEMPGVYREEELDFAGACVGLVEREAVIDGSRIEARDVLLGFPSLGLHTNGFSLVRKLVGDGDFDADLLLAPHKLYVEEVRALRGRADVKALAHVTGGGILGNLSRVLPEGRTAEIDWDSWERPAVYDWLTEQGVSEEEQRKVFNVGIGMCAVVPASDAAAGRVIGRVV